MSHPFIQEVEHEPKKPVQIERGPNDVIYIEGVAFAGDYFREFAHPDTNVLYAVRREGNLVWLTTVRSVDEAKKFFGAGDRPYGGE